MSIKDARAERRKRALELRALEVGRVSLREALLDTPKPLLGADLFVVMMRCPGLGRSKIRQVCEGANVWPHTSLGDLSKEQVDRIIDRLPAKIR